MDFSYLGREASRIRSRIKTCTICVREHVVETSYNSSSIPAEGPTKSRGVIEHFYNQNKKRQSMKIKKYDITA
jgi:hypothetical protein